MAAMAPLSMVYRKYINVDCLLLYIHVPHEAIGVLHI